MIVFQIVLEAPVWEQNQRRTGESVLSCLRQIAIVLVCMMMLPALAEAQARSEVRGTVCDFRGRPQLGALVELVGPSLSMSALTDLQGHFQFQGVLPGRYQLRASATLFVPTPRQQLQLQPSGVSIVTLTLHGLFNESDWISTRPDRLNQKDDWSWTLRSPENRPMLRLLGNTGGTGFPSSERNAKGSDTHAVSLTTFSRGVFGRSGVTTSFIAARRSQDQQTILSAETGITRLPPASSASPMFLSTSVRHEGTNHTRSVVAARFQTFPQVLSGNTNGLALLELSSAESMEVGDLAVIEAGSETHVVMAGQTALSTRPFLRLALRPNAGWRASYAFAQSPGFAGFDDVGTGPASFPVVTSGSSRLVTELRSHHQVGGERMVRHAVIRLAYHHDSTRGAVIPGELVAPHQNRLPSSHLTPLLPVAYDISSDLIRIPVPSYSTDGLIASVDLAMGHGLTASGTFLQSGGVHLENWREATDKRSIALQQSRAFLGSVQGKIAVTGTLIQASYRWQPAKFVSLVAPYNASATGPYLSVHLKQSLPLRACTYKCIEISIDGENLLAEGYQESTIAGQRVVLASGLRQLGASVAFSY